MAAPDDVEGPADVPALSGLGAALIGLRAGARIRLATRVGGERDQALSHQAGATGPVEPAGARVGLDGSPWCEASAEGPLAVAIFLGHTADAALPFAPRFDATTGEVLWPDGRRDVVVPPRAEPADRGDRP